MELYGPPAAWALASIFLGIRHVASYGNVPPDFAVQGVPLDVRDNFRLDNTMSLWAVALAARLRYSVWCSAKDRCGP